MIVKTEANNLLLFHQGNILKIVNSINCANMEISIIEICDHCHFFFNSDDLLS